MTETIFIERKTYTPIGAYSPVLFDVRLEIKAGDRIVLMGKNGSGKSTLLHLIEDSFLKIHARSEVRVLTQNANDTLFPSLTLHEHIRIMVPALKLQRINVNLILSECHEALPYKLEQGVKTLSGGEKQAFLLALVMMSPPKVLLLDEHTSALDTAQHARILELTHRIVTEQQLTSVVVTHHTAVADRLGSRFILVEEGRLFERER